MNASFPAILPRVAGLLCLVLCSCSKPDPAGGTIAGHVRLAGKIDIASAPREAKVYVYLKELTPKAGKAVPPWETPVLDVQAFGIRGMKDRKVAFAFRDLAKGEYGVSVLVDTGRPHVPDGSRNFAALPGDYAGGTKENVKVEPGRTTEVVIEEGLYVTIPDGYEAPLYAPE